jgi:PKD repeat protein
MYTCRAIPFFILFISAFVAFSQDDLRFVENKNQWPSVVLYKAEIPGGNLFLEKGGMVYDLGAESYREMSAAHRGPHNKDNEKAYRRHAYRITFEGAQTNPGIKATGKSSDYSNYFIGNNPSHYATYAYSYNKVIYNELYKGVDLLVYSASHNLKYDFVVKAGAVASDIKMKIEGADHFSVIDGNLVIETSVGNVTELKPVAFQLVNSKKQEVLCDYIIKDNLVTFGFPNGYDKSKELIIDPVLIFSTYSGSTSDNWGFTATGDDRGNVYTAGICYGAGFPVSMGSYQTSNAGIWDIAIIKYSASGSSRLFATYLGGMSCEIPHSLITNPLGELTVFGSTGSSDFPVTQGAFDTQFNGGQNFTYDFIITYPSGSDIFITKISPSGANLLASTFVGGSGNDGLNFQNYYTQFMMHGNDSLYYNYGDGARGEIISDSHGNFYIASTTFSSDFPVTPGAFQTTNAGKQEGVVFKISEDLSSMKWCTYIGGSEKDAAYSLDIDQAGNVFVCGGTSSANFPVTSGAYQTIYNGGSADGFMCRISNNGSSLSASSLWGSYSYDQVYFVRVDPYNNICITGQTKAPGSTFIVNAAYGTPNSGQFIARLNNNLSTLVWSTVFGTGIGKPNITISTFAVDVCNRICLAGWGREWAMQDGYTWSSIQGTKNMEVTTNAYQSVTDGQDFYLMVLAPDASQLKYATFFGEQQTGSGYCGHDHVDGGTSKFYKQGKFIVSVCASCGTGCNGFPTYPNPGVWSPNNGGIGNPSSWNCNNAVFVFDVTEDAVFAQVAGVPPGCSPYSVAFNSSSTGTSFLWDFGDGDTSTGYNPVHVYTTPGIYNVSLIAYDPLSCNQSDTVFITVNVQSAITDTLDTAFCVNGVPVQIGIPPDTSSVCSYTWQPSYGLDNPAIANPMALPAADTFYHLEYTHENCTDHYYQQVTVITVGNDLANHNDETFQTFPNPSEESFKIIYPTGLKSPVSFSLFDIQGRQVAFLYQGIPADGRVEAEVEISPDISAGIYWIIASDQHNKAIGWKRHTVTKQ